MVSTPLRLIGTTAKFRSECGTLLTQATQSAAYKQVTVLFADVVHSMDIAAAVGAERPKVAQDRYALGETFLHREDRAPRSVNCGLSCRATHNRRSFPGAMYGFAFTAGLSIGLGLVAQLAGVLLTQVLRVRRPALRPYERAISR